MRSSVHRKRLEAIKEDLVFNKYTGDLVGFVDLGDPDLNLSTFVSTDIMVTNVMILYIHALAGDLKFSLAYFFWHQWYVRIPDK